MKITIFLPSESECTLFYSVRTKGCKKNLQRMMIRNIKKIGATQSNSQENMPKAIKTLPTLIPKKEKTVTLFFKYISHQITIMYIL